MPLRRSPLFCARNSRLRGGEDPGRGRRELRLRGGFGCGAETGRNMELAGRGACAEGRDAGADGRELRGTRGRPLSGGERPAYREERLRAGSREARGRHIVKRRRGRAVGTPGWRIVAGRCRGAGGALPAAAGKSARGRAAAFPDVGGMGSKGRIFGFGFGNTAEKATFAPANGSLAARPQGLKGNAVQVCNSSRCCEFRPGCSGLSSRQSFATDLAVGKASRRKRVRRPAFACVERKPAENGRSEDRTRSRFFSVPNVPDGGAHGAANA